VTTPTTGWKQLREADITYYARICQMPIPKQMRQQQNYKTQNLQKTLNTFLGV